MSLSLLQAAADGPSATVWYALFTAMAGAIAALFAALSVSWKGRTDRCEKREDTLLTTSTEATATLREAATQTARAATIAEKAVEVATESKTATARNGEKIDGLSAEMRAVRDALAELGRDRGDPPPRRRGA